VAEFLPVAITNDVVGTVTALGENVAKFAVGDVVVGEANFEKGSPQNGTQEYSVLDADFTAKIPEGISPDEAATLPTNSGTAFISLFSEANLGLPVPWASDAANFDLKTQSILIVGGGTSCGKFGVQLASLAGLATIVVVGGPESELKSYGATHVLDRHLPYSELLAAIRAIVGDDLVYAYDAANPPETQVLAINALSSTKRGRFARLLPIGPIDETKVNPKKEGYELCDVDGAAHGNAAVGKAYWERLPTLLSEGKIKPGRYEVAQGLDADTWNALLDRYRDYLPVVKTHFHI